MTQYIETFPDGTTFERDWTEQELAQFETDRIDNEARVLAESDATAERLAVRESAMAKLAALGLNINEIETIVGSV